MKMRRVVWVLVAVVVLAAVAMLVPGSPVFLPNLLNWSEQIEGHSASYWIQTLNNPDGEARRLAIHNLGKGGAAGAEGVPALGRILVQDDDREARIEAALALEKLASGSRQVEPQLAGPLREIVPQLAEALTDREPLVRMNVAIALLRLGKDSRPAIPALIQALKNERNQMNTSPFPFSIQEIAARALGRASAGTAEGVPALMEALRDAGTEETRLSVTQALGEVGPEARPAVPQLRALLHGTSKAVREVAEEALRKIEGEAGPAEPSAADDKKRSQADDGPDDLQLAEAERNYLWEIEHHGNVLVKHGFGPLAEALRNADGAALARLLADDFAGTDLDEPLRVRAATDFAEVERLQDGGGPPLKLDRSAFVARLLEFRKVFADAPPQVKLALMTLRPKKRGRLDGPWEGTTQLRLHGEQTAGAPAEVVLQLRYTIPPPTEETLAQPGWLRAAGVVQAQIARAPRYFFAEVAQQRGLDPASLHDNWKAHSFHTTTGGVFVADFDRDGFLDVLVTDFTRCVLYRGLPGGTFEDVTARCGLPTESPQSLGAAWADLDGDGWDDLLLNGRVYRNEEGKHFADVTDRCELPLPRDAANFVVADYDRDGRLDLYVTRSARPGDRSWLDGRSTDPKGNYLFRNKGDWKFEDVTAAAGAGGGQRSTFTAAWLDANNDGWPDLYVINEFGDGVLLVNNGNGTFAEHALADRPADFGSMGLAVGDVDNDGNIDVYCANMYSKAGTRVIGNLAADAYPPAVMEKMRRFVAGSQLHLNKGGLQFEQAGKRMQVASVGWAYGACLADLDNDGWLDLYATAGFVSRNRDEPDG